MPKAYAAHRRRFPSAEAIARPYELYAEIRAEGAVVPVPGSDEYLVTRHEEILFVNRHPELFSNEHTIVEDGYMRHATLEARAARRIGGGSGGIMICDPPEHTAKRDVAYEYFKPGALRGYEATVNRIADELIDGFDDAVEFVSEYAAPLPARVIFDLLDLPQADVPRALVWGRYEGVGTRYGSLERKDVARRALFEIVDYVTDALAERRARPRNDVLSRFVAAHVARDPQVETAALVPDAVGLLIGGIITTTHMHSSAMHLLLEHPAQLDAVRADPRLVPKLLEETLRLESPVQWQPRLCLTDTEVGGVTVPAGAIVLLLYGCANRDERVFDRPDTFDVTRADAGRDNLAFGYGIHFCLGAPLARLEGRIAFERLFARVGEIRRPVDSRPVENLESTLFRGPRELQVELRS